MASEVLSVSHTAGVTNSESVLINGVSGHTYTILSITLCETAGAAETFDLYIDDNGGGTDYEIYSDQALGANETFEHTGRIVMFEAHRSGRASKAAGSGGGICDGLGPRGSPFSATGAMRFGRVETCSRTSRFWRAQECVGRWVWAV